MKLRIVCGIHLAALLATILCCPCATVFAQDRGATPDNKSASQTTDPKPEKVKKSGIKARFGAPPLDAGLSGELSLPGTTTSNTPETQPRQEDRKRGEVVFAPIPINSPSTGYGLVGIGAYRFKLNPKDRVSPPSVIGGGVMYTSSKSWALGVAAQLYLKEDRYRLTLAGGKGNFNYKLYGIGHEAGGGGASIPINQKGAGFFVEGLRRVGWNFFVGPRYQIIRLTTAIRLNGAGLPHNITIPELGLRTRIAAFGLRLQRDTRDNTFYPTRGSLFDVTGNSFDKTWGSNFNYQTYQIAYNKYASLNDRQVVAFRAMSCAAAGHVPFFSLCLFGSGNDLRGYSSGRYRDRLMLASQLEYRLQVLKKIGVVAFGGVGEVANEWSKFNRQNLLPGGGAGLRFQLSKQNRVNLRVDLGYGKSGHTLTIGLGEAF